jgi:hypothetical protein
MGSYFFSSSIVLPNVVNIKIMGILSHARDLEVAVLLLDEVCLVYEAHQESDFSYVFFNHWAWFSCLDHTHNIIDLLIEEP